MFKNIFSQKSGKSKTGFYKIESNRLIGIDEISGNDSINSVIEYLGYQQIIFILLLLLTRTKLTVWDLKHFLES